MAMRKATRKISGPQLERFFRHYYAQEPGLDAQIAETLARRSVATFSSVQVRRDIVGELGRGAVVRRVVTRVPAPAADSPSVDGGDFDPYFIGLVPTFQREGREGLIAKLSGVAGIDQLRQMARAQQISLPAELRSGDVEAGALRVAIADAVEKRIADRRAAAGDKG